MTAATLSQSSVTATRRVAADDVRPGMWLTVSRDVCELPSFFWGCETPAEEQAIPVRWEFTPRDSGSPLRVRGVCLPYVFVEDIKGTTRTIDLRQTEVTQLHKEYVDVVRKFARKKKKRKQKLKAQRRKLRE